MGRSLNTLKLISSGLGLMLFISIALATKNLRGNLEPRFWGRKAWADGSMQVLPSPAGGDQHPPPFANDAQCPAPPQVLGTMDYLQQENHFSSIAQWPQADLWALLPPGLLTFLVPICSTSWKWRLMPRWPGLSFPVCKRGCHHCLFP